jgi:hypothetical protein
MDLSLQNDCDVLENDLLCADPYDCMYPLAAGLRFLNNTIHARHPKCPLLKRIARFNYEFEQLKQAAIADPKELTDERSVKTLSEMNLLGTLGHSLWQLRKYVDGSGLSFELKEIAQIGCGEDEEGDSLRLRGQGFLLLSAANLSKQGFDLEFIPREKDKRTPDLFARRDSNTFTCEVTSRHPKAGDLNSIDAFWSAVYDVVQKKKRQLAGATFPHGVLGRVDELSANDEC